MNLSEAREARQKLQPDYIGKRLLISTNKSISRIVILPIEDTKRLLYIHLIENEEPNWLMRGFDENRYYNGGIGIYRDDDHRYQDELTLFALLVTGDGKRREDFELAPIRTLQDNLEI